jgi:hypothetical protein
LERGAWCSNIWSLQRQNISRDKFIKNQPLKDLQVIRESNKCTCQCVCGIDIDDKDFVTCGDVNDEIDMVGCRKRFHANCVNSGVRDSINNKFICLECTSRVAEGSSEAVRQAPLSRWELLNHPPQVVQPDVQVDSASPK